MHVTSELIDRLRGRLRAAAYTLDAVSDRIGPAGVAGLARNTTVAAAIALGDARDPQATLIRLWLLHQAVPATAVAEALGDADALVQAGLLRAVGAPAGSTAGDQSGWMRAVGAPAGFAAGDADAVVQAGLVRRGDRAPADLGSERVLANEADGWVRAEVEIRPYAAAGRPANRFGAAVPTFDGWVCHDLIPTLDGRVDLVRPDFVLGLSPASTTLAELTMRGRVRRVLDLGTGCGVQALHLSQHADQVVATDLNPRALELADLTGRLNGLDLDLRLGSLYEPVAGEGFDLIVTNPPYVMSPPTGERLVYREGTLAGDELVRRVVVEGAALLTEGGVLQVLGNWAILSGEPWEDRLRGWIAGTGCDALVLQRERLDPYEYIEIWLNDAGLTGTAAYADRYADWVRYFDALGIEGVGMGWIALRRTSGAPHVQVEQWSHAVHQPVGDAFAAFFAGVDALRAADAGRSSPVGNAAEMRTPTDSAASATGAAPAGDAVGALDASPAADAAVAADRPLGSDSAAADQANDPVLDVAWVLDAGVVQETLGRPGAEDPQHLVLRQGYGFGRAVEVDTALGAVLGACDGDLSAGRLVAAVADLLDVDPDALASEIAPKLRALVLDGWLSVRTSTE